LGEKSVVVKTSVSSLLKNFVGAMVKVFPLLVLQNGFGFDSDALYYSRVIPLESVKITIQWNLCNLTPEFSDIQEKCIVPKYFC
jgi:hypothetical protein